LSLAPGKHTDLGGWKEKNGLQQKERGEKNQCCLWFSLNILFFAVLPFSILPSLKLYTGLQSSLMLEDAIDLDENKVTNSSQMSPKFKKV